MCTSSKTEVPKSIFILFLDTLARSCMITRLNCALYCYLINKLFFCSKECLSKYFVRSHTHKHSLKQSLITLPATHSFINLEQIHLKNTKNRALTFHLSLLYTCRWSVCICLVVKETNLVIPPSRVSLTNAFGYLWDRSCSILFIGLEFNSCSVI